MVAWDKWTRIKDELRRQLKEHPAIQFIEASAVSVTLKTSEKTVILMIRDDGLIRTLRSLNPEGGRDIEEKFEIESNGEALSFQAKNGAQLTLAQLAVAPLVK